MKHFYQNIDGYMTRANTVMLDHVISLMPEKCHWVELGAWTGRSTAYCVVELINSGKFHKFSAVDSWLGCEILQEHTLVKNQSVREVFFKNVSEILDKIQVIESLSWAAAEKFPNQSLDFCYVDAGHSYDAVMLDLEAWWPRIRPGAHFGGDDFVEAEFPGVVAAVNEFFGTKHISVQKLGRCWLVQKPLSQ